MYPSSTGGMERPRERGKNRIRVEAEMIRRRKKEFTHQQMWSGADKYFRHWEKANSKFDSWTSPRYYEDNNKLMSEIQTKRNKEEQLEKRREKLRRLLEEDQRTYDIELMVHKNKNILDKPVRHTLQDIPTDVLKEVNVGLKLEEENKRRHEAEIKLYHQWRKNNPLVRQYECKYRGKELKLSWLDQQIEKRMQKEKEEEECKRILKERDERLRKEKQKEENFKKYIEEKRQELKQCLDQQIAEMKKKQEISEELRKTEEEESRKATELAEIEERYALEEKRRLERECALYNIRQYKLKLKQRALDIQENLRQEQLLIVKLKELHLKDLVEDEAKRKELKDGLAEFSRIIKEQKDLEQQRQRHLEFLFDSEATTIYEKQCHMWKQEELARQKLVKKVIDTVKTQIEYNLEKNKERQKEILFEREEMARKIEEYDRDLQKLKEEEETRKISTKKMFDDEVKVKNARKKQQENLRMKEIDEELERIRKEEERLQQEILNIQRRQGPIRPTRSRLYF